MSVVLESNSSNKNYSVALVDISTGEFLATELKNLSNVFDEISRFSPKEIIINKNFAVDKETINRMKNIFHSYITEKENIYFEEVLDIETVEDNSLDINKKEIKISKDKDNKIVFSEEEKSQGKEAEEQSVSEKQEIDKIGEEKEKRQSEIYTNGKLFGKYEIDRSEIENMKDAQQDLLINTFAIKAITGLHNYINETQKIDLSHLNVIKLYFQNEYMAIDLIARKNLEINRRIQDRK